MQEEVVLVDEFDNAIGTMEKMEAHEKGLLHRAFSVFIFNSKGQMLLQRRAFNKYHSGGLWTNTCCSHPRPGEDLGKAAKRRLHEEMGLSPALFAKTSFIYKASFDNLLSEYEFDHIFTGVCDENPIINTMEVESYQWLFPSEIKDQMRTDPSLFTAWFKIAMEKLF